MLAIDRLDVLCVSKATTLTLELATRRHRNGARHERDFFQHAVMMAIISALTVDCGPEALPN